MIKLVPLQDIDQVMEIIKDAKKLLATFSSQWQDEYPTYEIMEEDIRLHHLYGRYKNDKLVAIASFIIGEDPNYHVIDEGKFIYPTNARDLVIHRIAVRESFHHQKLVDEVFTYAKSYASQKGLLSIKCDTGCLNKAMQCVLERNNFVKRGIIYIQDDLVDPRRYAYEMILK